MVMQIWCQTFKNTVFLLNTGAAEPGVKGEPRIFGPGSQSSIVYYSTSLLHMSE